MRPLTSVQSCCGYFLQNQISSHPVPILIHARSAPIRGLVDYFWFSFTDLALSFVYSAARLCGLKYITRYLSLSNGRSKISTFTIWTWLLGVSWLQNPTGMNQCYFHSARITSHLLLRSTWIVPLPSDPGWWERRPWERRPPDEVPFLPVTPPELLEPLPHTGKSVNAMARPG